MKLILCTIAIGCVFSSSAPAETIVIDSGHEPSNGGATGVCQQKEFTYNDDVVAALRAVLGKKYKIVLTREKDQEVEISNPKLADFVPAAEKQKWEKRKPLFARGAIANQQKADFFLSIHHDSVSAKWQQEEPTACAGKPGHKISAELKKKYQFGYNIFLNPDSPKPVFEKSMKFARLLAGQMKELGRIPSTYHVFPDDDCKSCKPIDPALGIWSHDLAILRTATMPAVLVEIGVIADQEDEKKVSDPAFRQKLAVGFEKAFQRFFKTP